MTRALGGLAKQLAASGTRILDFAGAQAAANWILYTSTGTPSIADTGADYGIEGGGSLRITQADAVSSKTAAYRFYNSDGWNFGDAGGLFSLSCIFPAYPARWVSGNAATIEIMISSDASGTFTNYKGITLFNGTVTGVGGHNRQVASWRKADWTLTGGTLDWTAVKNIRLKVTSNGAAENVIFQGLWYQRRALPHLIMTFDDGFADCVSAASIATSVGIPLTCYVIPTLVEASGLYLTEAQIATLAAAGHSIAVHGVDTMHDSADYGLAEMTGQQAWVRARGYDWQHFAYPGGAFAAGPKAVMATLGMKTARTIRGYAYSAGPPEQWASQVSYEGCKSNIAGPTDWYEINASPMSSAQTLAQAKTALDTAIQKGESIVFYGHKLGAAADTTTWTTSDFTSLCAYAGNYIRQGVLRAVTMPEFYRRFSGTAYRGRA